MAPLLSLIISIICGLICLKLAVDKGRTKFWFIAGFYFKFLNSPEEKMKTRARRIISVAFTCIFAGGFIGATTNMINGVVSPLYFKNIMRWQGVENIWRASIAQGIFEGLIYGILFAMVFATVYGIVTKSDCPYLYAFKFITFIILAVFCCWTLGGFIAICLSILSPEFYRQTFYKVPESFVPMLKYAWVGGSIWGAMFGGLLSTILGSVIFSIKWKR